MESSRTCPWPRGSSRTISIVLGLGLVGHVLDSITSYRMTMTNVDETITSFGGGIFIVKFYCKQNSFGFVSIC